MNDCLLMIQTLISQGDQKAFAELYARFSKRLTHFSYNLVRSKETAEEIVEDVFVKLWVNRASVTQIENITVYLYVAVKNRTLNTLSKKAHELITAPFDFLEIDINSHVPDPHELMITSEMMQKMQKAVNDLPPRCKMIFKLVREDGLRYKEVAQVLNISVNTIDAQMAIAIKKICNALHLNKAQMVAVRSALHKAAG